MSKKTFIILILPALVLIGAWFLRGVFATSNPHTWTNGLVGYWSFDGQYTTSTNGTRDVSGNNNWGTFSGGVKTGNGVSGQGLSFDGADDYVDAGNGASLPIGTSARTFEAWVYLDDYGANSRIVSSGAGTAETLFDLVTLQTSGNIYLSVNGGANDHDSGTPLPTGGWHQVAVTYNSPTSIIYLDGKVISTKNHSPVLNTSASNFNIGRQVPASNEFWDGLIDEVRIYNRALSANEVKQHHDQTKRNLVINNPSGTSPVGWWKMDEGTGQAVKDYSGNNNNGTVTNGGYGATSTDGKIGKALSFDGTDDYVQLGASGFSTGAKSVSAWIKLNALNANQFIADESNSASYGGGLSIRVRDTNVMRFWGQDANYVADGTTILTTGTWYFITGTFDGTNNNIYINGVLEKTNGGVPQARTVQNLQIGHSNLLGGYFNGLIDDVRIYNYARTADQIAGDYRAGAYRTVLNTSNPHTWTNGLVGYWSFDGQYTTSTNGTRDVSGNNNWGTFSGGVKTGNGVSGQGLSFDGVDDYVAITSASGDSLNPSTSITFSAWFYLNSYSASQQRIVDRWWPYYLMVRSTSNTYEIGIRTTGDNNLDTSISVPVQTWTFVAFSYDSSAGVKFYENGALRWSNAGITGTMAQAATNIGIGANASGGTPFGGKIDEVRIYNRALSADEIKQHYQQTKRSLIL